MKVQKVRIPDKKQPSWVVLDDGYMPILPIRRFTGYLESVERSPNTIRSYAYHLRLYWEYLKDAELDWKNIGVSELAGFISWLRSPQPGVISIHEQEAKRTEATVNAIITSVCMFYDFQERIGEVDEIPLYRSQVQHNRRYKSFLHHITKGKPVQTKLLKLKEPKRIPKTLTKEQVDQLTDACNRIRDKFLITLLHDTGMRIGQALGLRHEDIQSQDNVIRIVPREDNINGARAKTRETYPIHVSMELMDLYTEYLLEELGDYYTDYVFVNLWDGEIGAPMKYGAIAALFRRLSKKTGIAAHPHMFRHTHATDLIRSNWDAARVQKRLGHAHVQTVVNTYTHLNDEDMKQSYQDYMDKRERKRTEDGSDSRLVRD